MDKKWKEYVKQIRKTQLLHKGLPYVKKDKAVDFCKFIEAELRNKSNLPDRVVMALKMLATGDDKRIYGLPVSLQIARQYWNGKKEKRNER